MAYFTKIYKAALIQDREGIKTLLAKGACIDERERSEAFTSVAGKLAQEKNIEAALFLVNSFGASIEFVIHGFQKSGCIAEANKLIEFYKLSPDSLHFDVLNHSKNYADYIYSEYSDEKIVDAEKRKHVQAAIVAGDMDFASELLKRYHAHLPEKDLIDFAAHGGHLYFIEKRFARDKKLPEEFAYWSGSLDHAWFPIGWQSARFANAELALHSLSFINNPKFLEAVLKKFIFNSVTMDYNIECIAEQAKKIHQVMKTENMDYPQALQFCNTHEIKLPPRKEHFKLFSHEAHIRTDEQGHNVVEEKYSNKCAIL